MDCQQPFLFSAGEQEFFARKGFKEEPKRCKPCRDQRKNRRMVGAMSGLDESEGDDAIGNRAATRMPPRPAREAAPRDPGGRDPGGRSQREMFDATCAQCGAAARVPFRPLPGRPVYCRDCFGNRAGGSRAGGMQ